jgi:hypothetical protein
MEAVNIKEYTIAEMIQASYTFASAYTYAQSIDTDSLFELFDKIEYKAFGFGAVQLWKVTDEPKWDSCLRNDSSWKEQKLDYSGKTAKQALEKLYAWCVYKGYLPNKTSLLPSYTDEELIDYVVLSARNWDSNGEGIINNIIVMFNTIVEYSLELIENDNIIEYKSLSKSDKDTLMNESANISKRIFKIFAQDILSKDRLITLLKRGSLYNSIELI